MNGPDAFIALITIERVHVFRDKDKTTGFKRKHNNKMIMIR